MYSYACRTNADGKVVFWLEMHGFERVQVNPCTCAKGASTARTEPRSCIYLLDRSIFVVGRADFAKAVGCHLILGGQRCRTVRLIAPLVQLRSRPSRTHAMGSVTSPNTCGAPSSAHHALEYSEMVNVRCGALRGLVPSYAVISASLACRRQNTRGFLQVLFSVANCCSHQ